MKKLTLFLIIEVSLSLLFMASCAQGVTKDTFEQLKKEYQELELKLSQLEDEKDKLQNDYDSAIIEKQQLQDEIEQYKYTFGELYSYPVDKRVSLNDNIDLSLIMVNDSLICGGDNNLVVLINNKEAHNPTYNELMDFLKNDWTDYYPYNDLLPKDTIFIPIIGNPWDSVDLDYYRSWVNHDKSKAFEISASPRDDRMYLLVCADYAEIIHNNAELAGIKSGYVSITFADETNHALNIFKTTDNGICFTDSTGEGVSTTNLSESGLFEKWLSGGEDKIAHVKINDTLSFLPIQSDKQWQSLGVVKFLTVQWD